MQTYLAVSCLLALADGLEAQALVERAHPARDEALLTLPLTVQGFVMDADGAPAEGALVVSSAGGKAVAGVDGAFQLQLELPLEAEELHVTALRTKGASTQMGSVRVATAQAGRTLALGTLALSSSGTCEPAWLPTFGEYTDLPSAPRALVVFDDGNGPKLYACGGFADVARLDGTRWTRLDGFDTSVQALAVFDEGNGPRLFAGGSFLQAGGVPARSVARWDGTSWSEVGHPGTGDPLVVLSLAVHDDGSGPALYVGGNFDVPVNGVPVRNIARWSGTSWSLVANPPASGLGADSALSELVTFDDGLGGGAKLYAIEGFDVAGSPVQRLLRLGATGWSVLTDAFTLAPNRHVEALAAYDDGLGGGPALYVGGGFTAVAGVPANGIARWDGAAWTSLGAAAGTIVQELGVVDDGGGAALYAGGDLGKVHRWDGLSWTSLPDTLTDGTVSAFVGWDAGSGRRLFVGSGASSIGDADCFFSCWDGVRWATLEDWLNGPVLALVVFDDGLGGGPALYAGGEFSVAGGVATKAIGKWDGTSWSSLGSGMRGSIFRTAVNALAVHDDGSGPALYAAGAFVAAGGTSASNIAKWDGTSWTPLGAGLNSWVLSLASFDDGLGGGPALYAGGIFSASGPQPAAFVARWDGTSWAPLGGGMNEIVSALLAHDDGLGGGTALYAAGNFTTAGGVSARKIARWNGLAWTPLGSGLGGSARTLVTFDDGLGGGPALYVGGSFSSAGGPVARSVARWDGVAWSRLGTGMNSEVSALAVFDDGRGSALYASGSFTTAGGVAASHIARWNGVGWEPLGAGASFPPVSSLAVVDFLPGPPSLLAGGSFRDAGGTHDSYLGRWQGCPAVPPVIHCPEPLVAGAIDAAGTLVDFLVTAEGPGPAAPTVTCVPPSGSLFPLGTTLVTCTATSASGAQASCTFPVSVFRKAQRR